MPSRPGRSLAVDVAEVGATDLGAELGAIICGAELGGLYLPFLSFFLHELLSFVPSLSRFLSQPPLAQTTNLTLRSPIKTTDLQEQGILYALLIFHAWILFSVVHC